MTDQNLRYAWCFSHGLMHTFENADPNCDGTWVYLEGTNRQEAWADKNRRYAQAAFLRDLPTLRDRMAAIVTSGKNKTGSRP